MLDRLMIVRRESYKNRVLTINYFRMGSFSLHRWNLCTRLINWNSVLSEHDMVSGVLSYTTAQSFHSFDLNIDDVFEARFPDSIVL